MPGDNAATAGLGAAVQFPQDGAASGGIIRLGGVNPSEFVLPAIGIYEISYQVSVSEPGQLELWAGAGGVDAPVAAITPRSRAGRATGTSQISNDFLITTTAPNTTVSLRNPSGNAAALTITPIAGGASPVSASLVIKQLA